MYFPKHIISSFERKSQEMFNDDIKYDQNISILVDIVQANIEQINEKLDTGYEKIDLIIDLLNSILVCLERIENSTCKRTSVLGVAK